MGSRGAARAAPTEQQSAPQAQRGMGRLAHEHSDRPRPLDALLAAVYRKIHSAPGLCLGSGPPSHLDFHAGRPDGLCHSIPRIRPPPSSPLLAVVMDPPSDPTPDASLAQMTTRGSPASRAHRYSWAYNPPLPQKSQSKARPGSRRPLAALDQSLPAAPSYSRRLKEPSLSSPLSTHPPARISTPKLPRTPPSLPTKANDKPRQPDQDASSQPSWFGRSASAPIMSKRSSKVKVKRWDGLHRAISDWDGLRRVSTCLLLLCDTSNATLNV